MINGRVKAEHTVVDNMIDASKSVGLLNIILSIRGTIAEGVEDCTKATSLSKPLILMTYRTNRAINGDIISLIEVATTTAGIYDGLKVILDNCKPITNVNSGIPARLISEILFIKLSGNLIVKVVNTRASKTEKNIGILSIFLIISLLPVGLLI